MKGRLTGAVLAMTLAMTSAIGVVDAAHAKRAVKVSTPSAAGPELLRRDAVAAPQLDNAAPWQAPPILVGGATAYRSGEFLYQDFLYDDLGAGSLYSYPTDPSYAGNAADLVELRFRPVAGGIAVRITYNSMIDPELVASTIALGGDDATAYPMPHGANTRSPGDVFVTVHGSTADVVRADGGATLAAGLPVVVDLARRQVSVTVPSTVYEASGPTLRVAAAAGLWDAASRSYAQLQATPDATRPGGGAVTSSAFFNVAFRMSEPPTGGRTLQRDEQQGEALADGDITRFKAEIDLAKLASRVNDDLADQPGGVPTKGFFNRIYASSYEPKQGRSAEVSLHTQDCPEICAPVKSGRLQSYGIYVPARPRPSGGFGLTVMLHGSGGSENSYHGFPGMVQIAERGAGSILVVPSGRGPSHWYYGLAAADVFESMADANRTYGVDWTRVAIMGGSMGGYGAYKFASLFPDLFTSAVLAVPCPSAGVWYVPGTEPPGGEASAIINVVPSLRHVPTLSMQSVNDWACTYEGDHGEAAIFNRLDAMNYTYDAYSFAIAEHAVVGTMLLHDGRPAAEFMGTRTVVADPAHITYVVNEEMSQPEVGIDADHAYWLSALRVRDTSTLPIGTIDAESKAFGTGDPAIVPTQKGHGMMGDPPFTYVRQYKTPGAPLASTAENRLVLKLSNVASATVDMRRAKLTCDATAEIVSDGPAEVTLAGCNRRVRTN